MSVSGTSKSKSSKKEKQNCITLQLLSIKKETLWLTIENAIFTTMINFGLNLDSISLLLSSQISKKGFSNVL